MSAFIDEHRGKFVNVTDAQLEGEGEHNLEYVDCPLLARLPTASQMHGP